MNNPWLSLEELPGLAAVLPVWKDYTGENFAAFRQLCLDVSAEKAQTFPCPLLPICAYQILRRPDGTLLGSCESNLATCPDVQFSESDVTVLEFSWKKLGRAICQAFGLDSKFAHLPISDTAQIGTWSADEVPVILTIHFDLTFQHLAVAELAATLGRKFILFSPSSRMMDVPCLQMLNRVHAEFFPLDKTTNLTKNGTLYATKTPGELFKNFMPQPKETDKSVAERAFALVQQLDTGGPKRPPSVLTVFRLYCIEELSTEQIARKVHCSKSAIVRRLIRIRKKTGMDPKDLRRVSSHLGTSSGKSRPEEPSE